MSFKIISDHERDQIVDDLLKKFPQGPRKRLTKDDYEVKERWSSFKNCYAKIVVPLVSNFGYTQEQIVKVHWAMDEERIRPYIRERWPTIGVKAVSRRENRLEERIAPIVNSFKGSSGRGVWNVRFGETFGLHVIANTRESAIFLAKTILAGNLIPDDSDFQAVRVNVDDPKLLDHYNTRSLKRIRSRIEIVTDRMEINRKKTEGMKKLCLSLDDLGDYQASLLQDGS
jgi:hypothetical protein